jgi:hypothetical protein
LKSEGSASPFDEGMVVKKIWRASTDNPAGTPYSFLAMIDDSDGTTNPRLRHENIEQEMK